MQSSNVSYLFYFDWFIGPRFGGPPGYLWNLKSGFDNTGLSNKVEFIYNEGEYSSENASLMTKNINQSALFSFENSEKDKVLVENCSATDSTFKKAEFYSRHDWLHIEPKDVLDIVASNCKVISCHTTSSLIKVHNSLVKHGLRHRVILALTSHCPELPAREWASNAFNEGASSESSIRLYNSHNEMDHHAFRVADVMIFPCEEAMEPYYQTIPNFKKLFGQRDIRFVPTGAQTPKVKNDRTSFLDSIGVDDGQFVVSYIGRHNHVKGYDILKKVGQELLIENDDISFVIGGKEGPIESPLHPRWIEYGWTTTPGDILAASDVFVLPNKQTYFDLMLIEVLSLGVIVVASNTGGNSYFKGKSKGIFLYDSEEELKEILKNLKSKSKLELEILGQANLELYKSNHTVEKFAENYNSLLNNIEKDYFGSIGSDMENESPAVSVIIPVYNVEKYLDECLSSVEKQSFNDIEVIVIDDGSTDKSSRIINKYTSRDSRFKLLSQPNGGLSDARNSGLEIAKGEYITFLDSDDVYDHLFIEEMYKSCVENGTRLGVCGVEHIKDDGEHLSNASSFLSDELVIPKWKRGKIKITEETATSLYPSAWNKIYHKSLFDDVRYNKGLYYEDHPVFYKTFLQEEYFSYVPKCLYLHRDRAVGRITQDGSLRSLDVICVADQIYSLFLEKWNSEVARKQYIKVLLRLVWERSWVVNSPYVMSSLAKLTFMRLEMLKARDEEILSIKDPIIQNSFLEELRSKANRFGDWRNVSINHYSREDRIQLLDKTKWKGEQENELVELNRGGNFILVHPFKGVITTAELFGLGFFGEGTLSFSAALEHVEADSCDFRFIVSNYILTEREIENVEESFNVIFKSDWFTMSSYSQQDFEVALSNITPTMAVYFQSRLTDTDGCYSWLRIRGITAAPKLKGKF